MDEPLFFVFGTQKAKKETRPLECAQILITRVSKHHDEHVDKQAESTKIHARSWYKLNGVLQAHIATRPHHAALLRNSRKDFLKSRGSVLTISFLLSIQDSVQRDHFLTQPQDVELIFHVHLATVLFEHLRKVPGTDKSLVFLADNFNVHTIRAQ